MTGAMKRLRCKVYLRIVTFARAVNPNPINLNERTDDDQPPNNNPTNRRP